MTPDAESAAAVPANIPKDRFAGLAENWKHDIQSGFILFLIALPLCLGIAMASGAPPLAGIIAAVVGGMIVSQVSGSYVTINGPAAGLIVVIVQAIDSLGGGSYGYHACLAAIVISGLILLVMGLCKAGELGYFFPSSVVHGMLSAIGIIIMLKQFPLMLGVKPPAKEPLSLLMQIPSMLSHMNPEIALIGFISMMLLVVHTLIKNKYVKMIPAPIIVVGIAIALGLYFDLEHPHSYLVGSAKYIIDPAKYLVVLPHNLMEGITPPNFDAIHDPDFLMAVISITLIQGIETLLSCAAVDKLDVFQRRSNLSRDMAANGLGSAISGMIGGLPMIAEIVRSSANVNSGARTRWSNFFHGLFMFTFVVLAANLIDEIPLASLAALLVFTGFRLASPQVFKHMHKIGPEQTIIFVITIFTTLATDLLIGVFTGVIVKSIIHLARGAKLGSFFIAKMKLSNEGDNYTVQIYESAIFANFISIKKKLDKIPTGKNVTVDLSQTTLVDHTVMERLRDYSRDYERDGGQFIVKGLDTHKSSSDHALSSRCQPKSKVGTAA
jgi:MFS superfamily sulfate permease-like transporter